MEGNECYKFSTIRHYIERTGETPVRVIFDVGANVGSMTLMLAQYFPESTIYAFEPVTEYFELGRQNTRDLQHVHWFNGAVTMQHRYADDLCRKSRTRTVGLQLLRALPEGGPGWGGGSLVLPADNPAGRPISALKGYERSDQAVPAYELDEFLEQRGIKEIDVLKMDCEGCEHHVLGCAPVPLLSRLRFIPGEYHGIERFYRVMRDKLFLTHKVNLIGTRDLGCYFAERLDGTRDGILRFDKVGMLQPRPWLGTQPMDWHLFNADYVLPAERWFHALA